MLTRRNWMLATTATLVGMTQGEQPEQWTINNNRRLHTLHITNLHCEGCAKRLRNAIYKLEGVLKVHTNVAKGVAVITPTQNGNPSAKAIWQTTVNQKFQITKLETPNGTFEQAPNE